MSASSQNRDVGRRSTLSIETVIVDQSAVVIAPAGDLDLRSAPHLKRTLCDLLAAGSKRLVIDLGSVQFMDSTALGVLVATERRLASDERLVIAQPPAEVLRLLELTGLATGFRIFPTREAAVSHLSSDQAEAHETTLPLTADAALLLGIASTAMPFARSPEAQAERWLRALRRHGEAGAILASVGLEEAPVNELVGEGQDDPVHLASADAVRIVSDHAGHIAADRQAVKVTTTDVLLAVTHVYGETFERALALHGVHAVELSAAIERSEHSETESQA